MTYTLSMAQKKIIYRLIRPKLTRIPITSRVCLIDTGNEGRARDSRTP
jgi:hypothetical protein